MQKFGKADKLKNYRQFMNSYSQIDQDACIVGRAAQSLANQHERLLKEHHHSDKDLQIESIKEEKEERPIVYWGKQLIEELFDDDSDLELTPEDMAKFTILPKNKLS